MQLGFQAFLSLASMPSVKLQNILACLSPAESDHRHYRYSGPRQRETHARAHGLSTLRSAHLIFHSVLSSCHRALPVVVQPSYFHHCSLSFILHYPIVSLFTAFCSPPSLPFVLSQPVEGTFTWSHAGCGHTHRPHQM